MPITMKELHLVVRKGGHNAPGSDGICKKFFKATWGTTKDDILTVLNQIFLEEKISDQQKHGVITCLPKAVSPVRPRTTGPLP